MTEKTDQEKIDGYNSLLAFLNNQAKYLKKFMEQMDQIKKLYSELDSIVSPTEVRVVFHKIQEIIKEEYLKHCLMCNHLDYTWFEVLQDTCGECSPAEAINSLCEIHQQIAREQTSK